MCLIKDLSCHRGFGGYSCAVLDCVNNSSNPESTEKNKPKKGDIVKYEHSEHTYTVTRVEGDICHTVDHEGNPSSFIWRFRDGLNIKHQWGTM